jgi:antitoxin component YwqK of YwqJK toxin-antitoxin module
MSGDQAIASNDDSSSSNNSNMMVGYKIFRHDWTCRGYQFPFGEKPSDIEVDTNATVMAVHDGPVIMCGSGFHFCQRALDCLAYYPLRENHRYAQVAASDIIHTEGDKSVTNQLTLVKEFSFEEFKNMCTGTITTWYANGNKWSENAYVEGYQHGTQTEFHMNGRKSVETTYERGLEHGTRTEWFHHGGKAAITTYHKGSLHGPFTDWYECMSCEEPCTAEHAQKWSQITFQNDHCHGTKTHWHMNGQKASEVCYDSGRQVGAELFWDEWGNEKS